MQQPEPGKVFTLAAGLDANEMHLVGLDLGGLKGLGLGDQGWTRQPGQNPAVGGPGFEDDLWGFAGFDPPVGQL